jgi:membrane protein YqaA with SNARE-associated domain
MFLEILTNSSAWFIVLFLSGVGVLIHFGQYKIGERGESAIQKRIGEGSLDKLERAKDLINRRGAPAMLLTAIPGLASVLAFTAGLARIRILAFILFVLIAKLIRNALLLLSYAGVLDIFQRVSG